ncbi:MAG: efflux RND transporter periplasmic adaptor subunit [Flavobacteriaceae bacterium]|nr:efflux RND transporter periplasmic adaptor subunit [Flavobacteriaceae bacterium]
MKKLIYLFFIVLVSSCTDTAEEKPTQQSTVTVELAKAGSTASAFGKRFSGEVRSKEVAQISTRSTGFVEQVHADVGQEVTNGSLLVSMNSDDLNAKRQKALSAVTAAKAGFENASITQQRLQNLYQTQSASKSELDQAETAYKQAKAQLEAAQESLNEVDAQYQYTKLRAPFDGVVTTKLISSGDIATPGKTLLIMENPKRLEVIARIPENNISEVQQGDSVELIISGIKISARISELSPSASNSGGQYEAKISFTQADKKILPGMFVEIISRSEAESAHRLFIPKSALVYRGGLVGVYTLSQSNTAILRWLQTGIESGEKVEVLSGLSQGESYILSAEGKLFNGVSVLVK